MDTPSIRPGYSLKSIQSQDIKGGGTNYSVEASDGRKYTIMDKTKTPQTDLLSRNIHEFGAMIAMLDAQKTNKLSFANGHLTIERETGQDSSTPKTTTTASAVVPSSPERAAKTQKNVLSKFLSMFPKASKTTKISTSSTVEVSPVRVNLGNGVTFGVKAGSITEQKHPKGGGYVLNAANDKTPDYHGSETVAGRVMDAAGGNSKTKGKQKDWTEYNEVYKQDIHPGQAFVIKPKEGSKLANNGVEGVVYGAGVNFNDIDITDNKEFNEAKAKIKNTYADAIRQSVINNANKESPLKEISLDLPVLCAGKFMGTQMTLEVVTILSVALAKEAYVEFAEKRENSDPKVNIDFVVYNNPKQLEIIQTLIK